MKLTIELEPKALFVLAHLNIRTNRRHRFGVFGLSTYLRERASTLISKEQYEIFSKEWKSLAENPTPPNLLKQARREAIKQQKSQSKKSIRNNTGVERY